MIDKQSGAKIAQTGQATQFDQMMAIQQLQMDRQEQSMNQQAAIIDTLNTQARTLETLRNAMGVDVFTGPGTQAAFINQSREVLEAQKKT